MSAITEAPAGQVKPKTEDHRIRVAEERRQRMRVRLQQAILKSCTANMDFRLPSVEDVCLTADVSRSTFYKHYESVEDAVQTLGESLLDEMVHSLKAMFDGDTALERITMGLQLFLMRSATDPAWAAFVSRVVQISPSTRFAQIAEQDLRDASNAKEIRVTNIDAAMSIALGSMFNAIQHVHRSGDRSREYVESLIAMILGALGVPPDKADELVRKKSIHIRGMAPDFAGWWRDPWI